MKRIHTPLVITLVFHMPTVVIAETPKHVPVKQATLQRSKALAQNVDFSINTR